MANKGSPMHEKMQKNLCTQLAVAVRSIQWSYGIFWAPSTTEERYKHTHLAVFVLFCLVLSYATNMSLFCKLHFLFVKSWIPNFDWWKTDMEVCKRKMWMVWNFSQKGHFTSLHHLGERGCSEDELTQIFSRFLTCLGLNSVYTAELSTLKGKTLVTIYRE